MLSFADLKIRTKDKRLVTFAPNAVQERYLDELQESQPGLRWRAGQYELRGLREDILKARQQGMSTLWLALYFLDTCNTPLTQTLIVAHTREATERLFRIVHGFYEHLPPAKQPKTLFANKREIAFEESGNSISVGTAGNLSVGRGATLNNLHLSERAFWRDGDEVEASLLEAVPCGGNVTRETTANGLNEYYEARQQSENGASGFTPRFFAWFLAPEYRAPAPPDFARTSEETLLASSHNLDDEQLQWRRLKAGQLQGRFAQEYPANPREAFVHSGNPYFDRAKLRALSDALQSAAFDPLPFEVVREHLKRRDAEAQREEGEKGVTLRPSSPTHFLSAPPRLCGLFTDSLQVWELPQVGRRYVIGADTAEGLSGRGDHDWCAADVLDGETWAQVAHLHGRWDTRTYGLLLCELGRWYNTALLGIERNNHGHAVLSAALHEGVYPQQGEAEVGGDQGRGLYLHQEYDEKRQPTTRRPGWPTTTKTKYLALDGLEASLSEGDLTVRGRGTVGELLTFVQLPGGRAGGEGRSHDDRVTSLSIADALLRLRPRSGAPGLSAQMAALRGLMGGD